MALNLKKIMCGSFTMANNKSIVDEAKAAEAFQEKKEVKLETGSEDYVHQVPYDKLEYDYAITETAWGKDTEYSPDVKNRYTKTNEKNEVKRLLQAYQTFFKRDIRLGNLDMIEMSFCREYIDFAFDCQDEEFLESAIVAHERAVDTLELSQSKGGFLRKNMNTFIKKEQKEVKDSTDKTLFGKPKDNLGGEYQ